MPTHDLRAFYATMTSESLRLLRAAFVRDRDVEGGDETFINGRLKLIDAVLAERQDISV